MKSCKNCMFCKKDLVCNYIKEADFYKCDMDDDVILDPEKEGKDCIWFKKAKDVDEGALQRIFNRLKK